MKRKEDKAIFELLQALETVHMQLQLEVLANVNPDRQPAAWLRYMEKNPVIQKVHEVMNRYILPSELAADAAAEAADAAAGDADEPEKVGEL